MTTPVKDYTYITHPLDKRNAITVILFKEGENWIQKLKIWLPCIRFAIFRVGIPFGIARWPEGVKYQKVKISTSYKRPRATRLFRSPTTKFAAKFRNKSIRKTRCSIINSKLSTVSIANIGGILILLLTKD